MTRLTTWTTTSIWRAALDLVLHTGSKVAPNSAGAEWKGNETREIMGFQTTWPMDLPVILDPGRKMGYRFLAAEAAWILSGDNRVSTIKPFSKIIEGFSDDGQRFFGAYGPKFIEQLSFVVRTLAKDPNSRQAVINIWREQPPDTKDTPCTLSWQFLIRGGQLHCIATMRSSDLWTGVPYDVFNFSMVAAVVALELRLRGHFVPLGRLQLTAGSQHIYERDVQAVEKVLAAWATEEQMIVVRPIDLNEFAMPQELIDHLWSCARGEVGRSTTFLEELYL